MRLNQLLRSQKTLALFCLVSGSLSALSMAPANAWYVLFLTLPILHLSLTRTEKPFYAFLCGMLFGFGYFLFSLSWVGNALLVEDNPYRWVWPFAVCGLPLALSFFWGLATYIWKKTTSSNTLSGYFSFIACLCLAEWLRGHLFTGFPWNLFGYSWVDIKPIIQITAISNIYWLTAFTILWCSAPTIFFLKSSTKTRRFISVALIAFSFVCVYTFGLNRINTYSPTYHESFVFKIIQPNIPQHEKWDRDKITENFFEVLQLSYPTLEDEHKTTYIIWPETAISGTFLQDKTSFNLIKQMLRTHKEEAHLITGVFRRNFDNGDNFNSVVQITPGAQKEINNTYNKHHLVPFGEYLPLGNIFPLKTLTGFSGFQKGEAPTTFRGAENFHYSPLICYEIIFPSLSDKLRTQHSDVIINVTNDAWYGNSAGPHQHFTQAIFRAAETGIPVIRSANTGISGLINPLGFTQNKSSLFQRTNKIYTTPKALKNKKISYISQNIIFVFLLALMLVLGHHKKP